MKPPVILFNCSAALLIASAAPVYAKQDVRGGLIVGGRKRTYLLHVPEKQPIAAPAPLVILLHGDAGSGAQARNISGMNAIADREGFFVAYPNGAGWANLPPYSWNAQTCCGYAQNANTDDTGFIRQLISQLIRQYPIDPARIYAAGISNGGMMAHRLACELSSQLAAVAVVSGALTVASCSPQRPVPILMFHGTEDPVVPYEGGRGSGQSSGRIDPSAETAASFWASKNRCQAGPELTRSGKILRTAYSLCEGSSEVVLYALEGEGHAWPGGNRGWRFGQAPSQDISASELMWKFFSGKRLSPTETATQSY